MEAVAPSVSSPSFPLPATTSRSRSNQLGRGVVVLLQHQHASCNRASKRFAPLRFSSSSSYNRSNSLLLVGGADARTWRRACCASSSSPSTGEGRGGGRDDESNEGYDEVEVERALGMDGSIPGTSDEFVRRVSSCAYDMRRHLMQTIDAISYDVVERNPWREDSKPVYVLTQRENQLWTMKTRRSRSEIERELGLLFSKGGKRGSEVGTKAKHSRSGARFQMLVEDIREGVLVFEDVHDAVQYCDLLQGGGQGCEGVAELEASSVFDICHKMRALAVLFRRGRTPPLPKSLEQNLRARKRSLEDQQDLI